MLKTLWTPSGLIAALVISSAGAATVSKVDEVLDANHRAMGAMPASGTLTSDYQYATSGLVGDRLSIDDLATGAFVDSDSVGPFRRGFGYDGKIPWMRDLSGANTPQQGGDRIQTSISEAYRRANLWWRADHGGAKITYVGHETMEGTTLDHLSITPRGGKPFDAWFDTRTHLLSRIAEERQFFKTQTFYADYAREGAVMLPHTLTFDSGVGKDHYETLKLRHATFGEPRPLAAYAMPDIPPTGMTIEGGKSSVTMPFRLLNNHIYVEGFVNGKGPYTFIVDTGGHTLLSPRAAAAAALATHGAAASSGTGEKVETSGFAQVHEITIGGIRMLDQTAFVTNVYDQAIEGIPVDGMLGFEFFRRFAVQIDYGSMTMTVTDFAHFDPKDAGTLVPFVFYDHLPFVTGSIDGMPARFDIDTGSRTELDITSPFVAKAKLRERYRKGVSTIVGWGAGGSSSSYVVRIPSMEIGSVQLRNIVGGLSESKGGSISDANYEGNIGSGLLKRFVVTFDYAHQRMYLKRLDPPPADAGQFDRSGLWINAEEGGYRVTGVATNSPAADAGFLVGDVILSMDGKPAVTAQLSDARARLRTRAAGTRLTIVYRRNGAEKTAMLTLRDQI
ncbi:MAG: aspartyl protease family protein [Rhodanobacter sp.]